MQVTSTLVSRYHHLQLFSFDKIRSQIGSMYLIYTHRTFFSQFQWQFLLLCLVSPNSYCYFFLMRLIQKAALFLGGQSNRQQGFPQLRGPRNLTLQLCGPCDLCVKFKRAPILSFCVQMFCTFQFLLLFMLVRTYTHTCTHTHTHSHTHAMVPTTHIW